MKTADTEKVCKRARTESRDGGNRQVVFGYMGCRGRRERQMLSIQDVLSALRAGGVLALLGE